MRLVQVLRIPLLELVVPDEQQCAEIEWQNGKLERPWWFESRTVDSVIFFQLLQ